MNEADPSMRDTDKLVSTAKAPSTTKKEVQNEYFTEFGTKGGEH